MKFLGLMVGAGMVCLMGPSYAFASELATQIREDVKHVGVHLQAAQDWDVWTQSGYTPEDVLKNVRDLKSDEAKVALCTALLELTPVQLAAFGEQLVGPFAQIALPCVSKIQVRLETYWAHAKRELRTHADSIAHSRPGTKALGGEVALVFVQGPHPQITPEVLRVLKAEKAEATFFDTAAKVGRYPKLVAQEAAQGHAVAPSVTLNHMNIREAKYEASRAVREISSALSRPGLEHWFDLGSASDLLESLDLGRGTRALTADMDPRSWKHLDPSELYSSLISELDRAQGGVLVLHESGEQTAIVLPQLLHELKRRNIKIAGLTELAPMIQVAQWSFHHSGHSEALR